MTRLVQLQNGSLRSVALVDEPVLRQLKNFDSIYALAHAAADQSKSLVSLVQANISDETLEYDAVYAGRSPWKIIVPIDHPADPARCLVSGTGLTHFGSAKNRAAMHERNDAELTDSMKMFRWGLEGGRPEAGKAGRAPEWFYKGNATVLRGPNDPLEVPPFGSDGGEEAEIAGVYLIDTTGRPRRIGMTNANEFSDHKFEKTNYLNLASSKIRTCSIGPELVVDPDFTLVPGKASIERAGQTVWSKDVATGEEEMCHSLANMEHHHFKFETHRRPGDLHVHYYGACALSFGDGFELQNGDVMKVAFKGFGRPLVNPLTIATPNSNPIGASSLA